MRIRHLIKAVEKYQSRSQSNNINADVLIHILKDAELIEEEQRVYKTVKGRSDNMLNDPITKAVTSAAHGKIDVEKIKAIKSILVVFFREGTEGDYYDALNKAVHSLDLLTIK